MLSIQTPAAGAHSIPTTRQFVYAEAMTVLLDQAIEVVRTLPSEAQDDLTRMLLQFAGVDRPMIALTTEEAASLDESLTQADRGEFASDEQIHAIWAKHGL